LCQEAHCFIDLGSIQFEVERMTLSGSPTGVMTSISMGILALVILFFAVLIRRLFPGIKFSSHLHTTAGIKIADKCKVPVFILIRNPADAIVSNLFRKTSGKMLYVNQSIVDDLTFRYTNYYNYVMKNISQLNILHFDELIHNEQVLMQALTDTLGLKKHSKNSFKEILKETKEWMRELEKKQDDRVSSFENETRKIFKQENIDLVYSSKYYADVQNVYDKIKFN